jgi:hypothetical protein
VDFPQPEGPISAVTILGSITKLTRSKTLLLPNQALTFDASSIAGWSVGEGVAYPVGAPRWRGASADTRWLTVVMRLGPPISCVSPLASGGAVVLALRGRRTRSPAR